jgi:carboxyl-terminal processing protease
LSLNKAVDKLRGPVNSKVRLTVVRAKTSQPIEVTLVREVIRVKSTRFHAEGDDVGYIRLSQFNEQSFDGTKEAIRSLETQLGTDKIKGYVLDLRKNQGGLLDQAIAVSDIFLDRGAVVTTRGRTPDDTQKFNARPGDSTNGKPVIVLIDGGTAAAAEIVAAALQDNRRATVLGTRSYGNGTLQTIVPLGAGEGALRLTTARFFRPSGKPIDGQGITPDIQVEQTVASSQSERQLETKDDKQLLRAIALLRGVQKNPFFPPSAR